MFEFFVENTSLVSNVGYCAFFNKSKHEEYDFLSNFHDCPVLSPTHGTFRCSEGLYHYQKFLHLKDSNLHIQFKEATGQEAWDLSRRVAGSIAPEWDRIAAMQDALKCKFSNKDLKQKLLGTKNAYIVENSTCGHDLFWSDYGNGRGENKLGIMLMELRKELGGEGVVSCPDILKELYEKTCENCQNCCHFTNYGLSTAYCDEHLAMNQQHITPQGESCFAMSQV